QRLARTQREARVVPGTADRVLDDQTLRERAAPVRARGADRAHRPAVPHQQHRLAVRVPEERLPLGKRVQRGALAEVRTVELRGSCAHGCPLSTVWMATRPWRAGARNARAPRRIRATSGTRPGRPAAAR